VTQLSPVLHVDGVDVGIGAGRKGDEQAVAAIGTGGRLEVERIVDAAHLLLDRLGDGLGHYVDRRRCRWRTTRLRRDNVGQLGDGQRQNGEAAASVMMIDTTKAKRGGR